LAFANQWGLLAESAYRQAVDEILPPISVKIEYRAGTMAKIAKEEIFTGNNY